jgi:ubiquinone/menaquinone biosynthesis C-methylase UbiE
MRGLFEKRNRHGWSEEVEELTDTLRSLPPSRTLDVACGTGFLTRYLPGEVVAIDQSAEMARIAAARMPDVRVLQGDAVPLPFADADFDRLFRLTSTVTSSLTSVPGFLKRLAVLARSSWWSIPPNARTSMPRSGRSGS